MVEMNERFQQTHVPPSIEETAELRDELLAKRMRKSEEELKVKLEELVKGPAQAYLQQLHGFDRIIAQAKEFMGRGIEHDYKEQIKGMQRLSGSMKTALDNIAVLIKEYRTEEREYQQQTLETGKIIDLNYSLFCAKKQQKADKETEIAKLREGTILGSSVTAESIAAQDQLFELEDDLWKLDTMSEDLANDHIIAKNVLGTYGTLTRNLLEVRRGMSEQRTRMDLYVRVASAQHRIVQGVKNTPNVAVLYAQARLGVQELQEYQTKLQQPLFQQLPYDDFKIQMPTVEALRSNGQRQWLALAAERANGTR